MRRQVSNQGESNRSIIHVTQYMKVACPVCGVRRCLSPVESPDGESCIHAWQHLPHGHHKVVCSCLSSRPTLKLQLLLLILSASHTGVSLSHGLVGPFLAVLFMTYLIEKFITALQVAPEYVFIVKIQTLQIEVKALLASSAAHHATLLPCDN